MTGTNNETKENLKLPIITLIIGTLLGSGSVWKYLEYTLADKELDVSILNKSTKIDIDLDKLELEKKHLELKEKYQSLAANNDDLRLKNETLDTDLKRATHTTLWRKDLEQDLISIINLTHDFEPLNLCNNQATSSQRNTAIDLSQQLKLKKENFERLEFEIANFEKREVRDINLQFSPPCPPVITGFKVIKR